MPNTNNSSNPNELVLSITAETSQAKKDFETLRKSIEELGKEFGRLKRTDTSIEIAEEINKAQNPLKKALLFLTEIQKKIADTQKKRDKAFAIGANVEKLDKELEGYRQREKEIVRGIQDSLKVGALHKQELQINKQIRAEQKADFQARVLQNQKEIEQRKELLETNKKIATQQLISAISDIESGNRAEINRQIIEDRPVKSAAESAQVFIEQYAKADEALRNFELSLDPVKQKMAAVQQALQNARDRFVEFYRVGDAEGLKSAEKDIKQLSKELGKLQTNTKGASSWWGKLVGRIRNISIYRAIRTGLHWITQGVSEGLSSLAFYNKDVNDTMSSINNSLQQVRDTLSISVASILQSLQPLIVSITDTVIDALNAFNRAMAKSSGQDFYYRAKKSADDYAKSAEKARKFTFDSFNVLSEGSKNNFEKVYFSEEAKEAAGDTDAIVESVEDANNAFNGIADTLVWLGETVFKVVEALGGLKTTLIVIASYFAFKGVVSSIDAISNASKKLKDGFEYVKMAIEDVAKAHEKGFGKSAKEKLDRYFTDGEKGLNKMKVATTALNSAVAGLAALGIADTIFGQFEKEGKVIAGVIGIVAAAFAGLAIAALAAAGTMTWGVAIPAIVAAVGVGAASIKAIVNGAQEIQGFANGGFTTANFIATNENGRREWVGRNAGATAVVNDTQMSDIMYGAVREGCYEGILQAMYNNGSGQSGNSSNITIQVDKDILGRVVAESVGFRNEANRRNPALNLR